MLIVATIIIMGCNKPDEPNSGNNDNDVRVTTYSPQEITETTAACGGDVIVTQGLTITKIGVCWNTEQNPTVNDNNLSTFDWDKPFVCTLYHLTPNTTYHVRAFALRGLEYYYGEDKVFTTLEVGNGGGLDDSIPENPNYPNTVIDYIINLNSPQFYDLNIIGGYLYLTSDPESTSRGLIVYRISEDEFVAYDRLPPNEPDACMDSLGNGTRLIVDIPFVIDVCNNAYYNVLDGTLVKVDPPFPTDVVYPLFRYHTYYDADSKQLEITN